jgi:hypothetical protein
MKPFNYHFKANTKLAAHAGVLSLCANLKYSQKESPNFMIMMAEDWNLLIYLESKSQILKPALGQSPKSINSLTFRYELRAN